MVLVRSLHSYYTGIGDVYQECRELTKAIHVKVNKQCTDLKHFRSRVQKPILKTAPPRDNILPARFFGLPKSIKLMSPSDP